MLRHYSDVRELILMIVFMLESEYLSSSAIKIKKNYSNLSVANLEIKTDVITKPKSSKQDNTESDARDA